MAPEPGRLYLCATPIGNLEDITLRVLRALREVDCIAAEDTRHTRKLLEHFEIRNELTSLHDHNESEKAPALVERLKSGESMALVSDAGTPALTDPGFELVRACLEAGIEVVPLPGASALLAALVGSGLPPHPFYFGGFLPRKKRERRALLESLGELEATLVFYEVPHRLQESLAEIADLFAERRCVVARELTKVHEEFVRGLAAEVRAHFDVQPPRGECVLLIEGANRRREREEASDEEIRRALAARVASGQKKKEAIKEVASLLHVSRKRVYEISIES